MSSLQDELGQGVHGTLRDIIKDSLRSSKGNSVCLPTRERPLCDYCLLVLKDFRKSETKGTGWISHQPSLTALKLSASYCPLCLWLWKEVELESGSFYYAELRPDVQREILNACNSSQLDGISHNPGTESNDKSPLIVRCTISAKFGWYSGREAPSRIDPNEPNFMSIDFRLRRRPDDEDILASVDFRIEQIFEAPGGRHQTHHHVQLLEYWSKCCMTSHEACRSAIRAKASDTWKPSRLLEIEDLSKPFSGLKLCEAANNEYDLGVHYIALSHRWATGQQLLLLQHNHNQLQRAIPVEGLKKSIRDALLIAARLRIRYIWVDTLCILQDLDEDRNREISHMDQTYSHSTLTVEASDAGIDEEGCFLKDRNHNTECCKVRLSADRAEDITHYLTRREAWTLTASSSAIMRTILASRAWVFQERILSPRTIHCCRHQFHWECHSLEASELQPNGPGPEKQFMLATSKSLLSANQLEGSTDQTSAEAKGQVQHDWRRIVKNYTRGRLTFIEDKLRALAGVAAVWQRLYPDEYIFGMWRSTLLSDLCWLRFHEDEDDVERDRKSSNSAIAPSWSWASTRCSIWFHPSIGISDTAIKEGTLNLKSIERNRLCSTASLSSTSKSVHLAALHLRGHPKHATCEPYVKQEAKGKLALSFGTTAEDTITHVDFPAEEDQEYVWLDDAHANPPAEIVCLPLVIEDDTYSLDVDFELSWGIAILPLDGQPGLFRRVGIFRTARQGVFAGDAEDLVLV